MEEKYTVKILNYLMTQMLFNNIENKNLQENIIQIINNSVEKGEIKLKTVNQIILILGWVYYQHLK